MAEYEVLRQKHLAQLWQLIPQQLERITWSGERLRSERQERLRALVRVAKERSAWHRERLAHVDPERLRQEDLEQIPAMTKDDLMEHWDDIVTDRRLTLDLAESHLGRLTTDAYLLDRYHVVASAGSSGPRGVFVYDWDAWTLSYLGFTRWLLWERLNDPELTATPMVSGSVAAEVASHMTSAQGQTFSNPMLTVHQFPVTLPQQQIVAGLNQVQPTYLHGYPSALYQLTHEARAGNLHISPKRIVTSSEPLLPEIRGALEETWDAVVGNWWGTSEGGPTGVSCGKGSGMHLADDLLIIEPVDEEGRPVAPGVRSAKVYLTNLYNLALPLIRYEIRDEVTLLDEPCPCGSAHRRVDDIQGRLDDCFVYAGGVTVHPLVFRSALGGERNIVEYQVRQTDKGAEIAARCLGDVDIAGLRRKIIEELAQLGLREPEVSITPVERLERQAIGKLKRFFPLPGA
ncbi:MAG: phenylacetate--CoA ligase family protein [Dehalococcoidia bacterium]|nr:MAG: phenylacetate--CoA ligase family protein [Dehalococcoidia bacterium]